MNDIAGQLNQAIEIEAIKQMATVLLASEAKELKNVTKFIADEKTEMPEGVFEFGVFPGRYALLTPDGLAEVKSGDWILKTLDDKFYYLRLEKTE